MERDWVTAPLPACGGFDLPSIVTGARAAYLVCRLNDRVAGVIFKPVSICTQSKGNTLNITPNQMVCDNGHRW